MASIVSRIRVASKLLKSSAHGPVFFNLPEALQDYLAFEPSKAPRNCVVVGHLEVSKYSNIRNLKASRFLNRSLEESWISGNHWTILSFKLEDIEEFNDRGLLGR
ncbi:hypothetical protein KM043_003441 [Ampulex compressa]|nr:hypothetical protein KM043_003441 [Ampulex compressa]